MANPFPANFEGLDGSRRLTGQVNFTDPANQPGGGGSAVGAYVGLAATATVANGSAIPWDNVGFDPSGYSGGGGTSFVVPAGKAGLYLCGTYLKAETGGVSGTVQLWSVLSNSGSQTSPGQTFATPAAGSPFPEYSTNHCLLCELGVGDVFTVNIHSSDASDTDIIGGGNGSAFWLLYLGAG